MISSRISYLLRAVLFAALLALTACQTAPVQEMSDARQAISVARDAGAAEQASVEFKSAVDLLESAERHLNQRMYQNARRDALEAKLKALDALQLSETDKDTSD